MSGAGGPRGAGQATGVQGGKKKKTHSTAISEFNQILLTAGYQRLPGQARAGFQEPRLERGDGGGGERVGGEGGGSGGFVVGGGYDG